MEEKMESGMIDKMINTVFFGKGLLFVLCFSFLLTGSYQSERVIFVLLPLLLSVGIWVVKEPRLSILVVFVLLISAGWWPEYVYFLPFIFYDTLFSRQWSVPVINGGLLILFFLFNEQYSLLEKYMILVLCVLALYLAYQYLERQKEREERQILEDELLEIRYAVKQQDEALKQKQEILISLEISNERNRIARDIHDNVGHLLSSSLLQIGAIQTVNQNKGLEEPIKLLKETIAEGMDNVRSSVHDLHDESVELKLAMEKISQSFQFCSIELQGEFPEHLGKEYKLAAIMIVKEALANVMKHSNATQVTIEFKQLPGFYKLTVSDNGTQKKKRSFTERGIGLTSMEERLLQLKGRLNFHQTSKGFTLIAIFPKRDG